MYPLYNDKNKTIILWSYKCGCTFIKTLFYNIILNKKYSLKYIKLITYLSTYFSLDRYKLDFYKSIFICRNPYSRIVSCYIDKYINGWFTKYFNYNIIINNILYSIGLDRKIYFTFEEFVNILYNKHLNNRSFYILETNHLLPQIDNKTKIDKIYRLEDFDEKNFLLNEFEIEINDKINNDFGHSTNCGSSLNYNFNNAYELEYDVLLYLKNNKKIPNYVCFYNEDIKNKIDEIYKSDFEYLKNYNIYYEL